MASHVDDDELSMAELLVVDTLLNMETYHDLTGDVRRVEVAAAQRVVALDATLRADLPAGSHSKRAAAMLPFKREARAEEKRLAAERARIAKEQAEANAKENRAMRARERETSRMRAVQAHDEKNAARSMARRIKQEIKEEAVDPESVHEQPGPSTAHTVKEEPLDPEEINENPENVLSQLGQCSIKEEPLD